MGTSDSLRLVSWRLRRELAHMASLGQTRLRITIVPCQTSATGWVIRRWLFVRHPQKRKETFLDLGHSYFRSATVQHPKQNWKQVTWMWDSGPIPGKKDECAECDTNSEMIAPVLMTAVWPCKTQPYSWKAFWSVERSSLGRYRTAEAEIQSPQMHQCLQH